ncbi:MAG: RluA family pseudouridine synthase [Deltaproteobacteria bacterium]|nr:RluA family pseudouridine synthase [Deltaproteobacteria bacterium]
MPQFEFTIDATTQGVRLDKVVIEALGHKFGRARTRDLFAQRAVRADGHVVSKGDLGREGQLITVQLPDDEGEGAVAEPQAALDVRLETADFVVVCKPAGQPTAPLEPGEVGTLVGALLGHYPEMGSFGRSAREPGIVHRLDNGTSGLLVAARTKPAFEAALAALRAGEIHKRYLLVCRQEGLAASGVIDIPLAPHPKDTRRVLACAHERDQARNHPRPASTSYKVVERIGDLALVEASAPKALRHQLRAHFAAIDHPIEGDGLYGGDTERIGRQALHAHHLSWKGSGSLAGFAVDADLPEDMRALLAAARD